MSWLADNPTTLYVVFGCAAFATATAWWMTRKRAYASAFLAAALLLVAVWLISAFIDTDSKRIERVIRDMGAGVEAGDINRVFAHIAGDFSAGGLDRSGFRERADHFMRAHRPSGIAIWDYETVEISRPERRAVVIFKARTSGIDDARGVPFYNCRAHFVLGQDEQWRMSAFHLFLPTIDPVRGDPIPLPF